LSVKDKSIVHSPLNNYKITYRINIDQDPLIGYFSKYDYSPIEHLIIEACFPYGSLVNLLYCFPNLRRLSIDYLVDSRYADSVLCPNQLLKDLKHVSLKLYLIKFDKFEQIVQKFFSDVEFLRITTNYDATYLYAQRWEDLISSFMPNLRVFDLHHDGGVQHNQLTYHDLINRFKSSFWIQRNWFFAHQHDWLERLHSGSFYSTQPYT
jgi:hypothetical protein